jgi:general stress protein YciG
MGSMDDRGMVPMNDDEVREEAEANAERQSSPPSSAASAPASRRRGFAAMDESRQREIASKGGRAAHEKGTAHEFTRDEARAAGKKGGEVVSQNRRHMAEIGKKGGERVSQDREHMASIGRKGGESRGGVKLEPPPPPQDQPEQR